MFRSLSFVYLNLELIINTLMTCSTPSFVQNLPVQR